MGFWTLEVPGTVEGRAPLIRDTVANDLRQYAVTILLSVPLA